jgi:hypothetical protein
LLGYGRTKEVEADHHGILYASRAGYDPEAALTFFERLDEVEKEEEAGQNISPYWQSHPPTEVRLKLARKWISEAEKDRTSLTYNRDKFLAMVATLPRGEPAEKGKIEGNKYTNESFGLSLEVPDGWHLDNSRHESLVGFVGPIADVRGTLQRYPLPHAMGVQEFGKMIARQVGIPEVVARDADYPAGHGLLWQYGGDYLRYRSLLLIREQTGYMMTCQIPSEQYLQYIVDCERVMRSLQIQDPAAH